MSAELLTVGAILAGIVGLYFSGLAISDESYRREQYDQEVGGIRQVLAVRTLYLEALGAEDSRDV